MNFQRGPPLSETCLRDRVDSGLEGKHDGNLPEKYPDDRGCEGGLGGSETSLLKHLSAGKRPPETTTFTSRGRFPPDPHIHEAEEYYAVSALLFREHVIYGYSYVFGALLVQLVSCILNYV